LQAIKEFIHFPNSLGYRPRMFERPGGVELLLKGVEYSIAGRLEGSNPSDGHAHRPSQMNP